MKPFAQLPNELAWILLWCVVAGGLCLYVAGIALAGGLPLALLLTAAAFHFLLTAALFQLSHFARWCGGIYFAILFGVGVSWLSFVEIEFVCAVLTLFCGWAAHYLLSFSTARFFADTRGLRPNAVGMGSRIVFFLPIILLFWLPLRQSLPTWMIATTAISIALLYSYLFEKRFLRFTSLLFCPRPEDVSDEAWEPFKRARAARLRGEFKRAKLLLETLQPTRSVRLLEGLMKLDQAPKRGVLARLIFENRFAPSIVLREQVLRECQNADLPTLIDERNQLIEDLLADAEYEHSAFAGEFATAMEQLTGFSFPCNKEFRYREWWSRAQSKCSGPQGLIWLVHRLWEAQCLKAAEYVAEQTGDVMLAEAAKLSRMLDEPPREDVDHYLERVRLFCVFPKAADELEVLTLDSPFASLPGREIIPNQLELRVAIVDLLAQFQQDYPDGDSLEPRWLLLHLTGCDRRMVRSRRRFEKWWRSVREAEWNFDENMANGLRAALDEDWEIAEQAFGEARRIRPHRISSTYNQALVLIQMERYGQAEVLLEKLLESQSGEARYWIWLGDCRRYQGTHEKALQAYRKAQGLEDFQEEVSLRISIALAYEDKIDEAEHTLLTMLGADADAETLEELASLVETEGAFNLAQRFRQLAFEKQLEDWGETPDL